MNAMRGNIISRLFISWNMETRSTIIDEITMIDAGCMALAYGNDVMILMPIDGRFKLKPRSQWDGIIPAVAMVTGHKQFKILIPCWEWAVEPAKIREIHMNRKIAPWPREWKNSSD